MTDGPFSQREFVANYSQLILQDRDLSTPAPLDYILRKIATLDGWDMHGNREANEQYFPNFVIDFRNSFLASLNASLSGKDTVNGFDVMQAYAHAVEKTVPSRQMKANMHYPDTIGRLIDHFGIPVASDLIRKIKTTNPKLAGSYEIQAIRWENGSAHS